MDVEKYNADPYDDGRFIYSGSENSNDPNHSAASLTDIYQDSNGVSQEGRLNIQLASRANPDLPGSPYFFTYNHGQTPAGNYLTELNRMRAALFAKAEIRDSFNRLVGYQPWALVSDPYLWSPNTFDPLFITGGGTSSADFNQTNRDFAVTQWNGTTAAPWSLIFKDATYICQPNTTLRTVMRIYRLASVRSGHVVPPAPLRIRITEHDGSLAGIGVHTIQGFTDRILPGGGIAPMVAQLTFQIPESTTTNTISPSLSGRTDLLRVGLYSRTNARTVIVPICLQGPIAGRSRTITNDEELSFVVTLNVPGESVTDYEFFFRINTVHTATAGPAAVISPETSEWVRMQAKEFLITENGALSNDLSTQSHLRRLSYAIVDSGDRAGIWKARTLPIGILGYESIAGNSELWRWQTAQNFRSYNTKNSISLAADATPFSTAIPKLYQSVRQQCRAPSIKWCNQWWEDTARVAADWPDYQTIEVTIPDTLESAATFTLPGIRLNSNGGESVMAGSTNCQYYKIPLDVPPELETIVRWFDNPNGQSGTPRATKDYSTVAMPTDPFPDRTYQTVDHDPSGTERQAYEAAGTTAGPHYVHDARITNITGTVFWYQDLVAEEPLEIRFAERIKRYRHWFISIEGGKLVLYLLIDNKEVQIGVDGGGAPVYVSRGYFPVEKITKAKYRAAFGWLSGMPINNWAEFNPPFRFFHTTPTSPIAEWTVGRTSGGAWTAGATLKVHIPKRVPRQDLTVFCPRSEKGLEAGTVRAGSVSIRNTQLHELSAVVQPHKRQVLTLQNNSATLAYYPAVDLRLYLATRAEMLPGIDHGQTEYTKGRVINPSNYEVSDAGVITFNRTEDLGTETWPIIIAEYQHRRPTVTPIVFRIGNETSSGVFTPYKTVTIAGGINDAYQGQFAGPMFLDQTEPNVTYEEAKWIFKSTWGLAYQRVLSEVSHGVATTAQVFESTINGILARVTVPEDATIVFTGTWIAADATTQTSNHTLNVYKGTTLIQPWITYAGTRRYLSAIAVTSCVQNWKLKLSGRELFSDPTPQAEITGTPFRMHYNETLRLLLAWIAAGRP
jgi:hypothetical protein